MPGSEIQEWLALGVVALIVALAVWRRARRRRATTSQGCSNCDSPAAKRGEAPLRFYRRRP